MAPSDCAHEVAWEPIPTYEGARRKVLLPASQGPAAEIIECPPHTQFTAPVPAYGRYEVVYQGSVFVDGKKLGPKGLRFVGAGEEAAPLRCGPEGATLIVLTYDEDAARSYGGSTEEVIARMEQQVSRATPEFPGGRSMVGKKPIRRANDAAVETADTERGRRLF